MPEIRANNVPEELVKRFDIERAKRGRISIRDAVMEAIEIWIEAGEGSVEFRQAARQNEHEHELLDLLLSEDPEIAERIRGVLDTFARAVAGSRGRRPSKQKAG